MENNETPIEMEEIPIGELNITQDEDLQSNTSSSQNFNDSFSSLQNVYTLPTPVIDYNQALAHNTVAQPYRPPTLAESHNNNNNNNIDEASAHNKASIGNPDKIRKSIGTPSQMNLLKRYDSSAYGKDSLFVTARNLSVCVGSKNPSKQKNILTDLNFFLRPGSMVLLLGTPGCGKTTLMNALSLMTRNEEVSGRLLFNGAKGDQNTHHRHVSYVIQEDHHMAPLTVRETLKFSADLQMSEGSTEFLKNQRVDETLDFLDLTRVKDTVVGNGFIRGVSGGQKKRVTIGVELIKNSNLYLMDEPTTGLDSAISLELIKKIKDRVINDKVSCLVSLLQPGVEITQLFDYLMILNQGQMAYFGPMDQAIGYFEDLGFNLPNHHNPAEFFQEIVDEPELYCNEGRQPPLKGIDEFAEAYRKSSISKQINLYIDNNIPDPEEFTDFSLQNPYTTSLGYQTLLATKRGLKMEFSNLIAIRMRIMKSIVMGLILGSLFWKLEYNQTDGANKSGLVFFSLLTVLFGGFGAIGQFFGEREVFYFQRDWKYLNTFSYFLSMFIADIPMSLLETILFSVILYWMCALKATAEAFIYFFLMLLVGDFMAKSMMRMVSSFSPSSAIASALGPVTLSPFVLNAGFMLHKPQIPGWWVWVYWISPVHYGFEGLMNNEHHNSVYTCDPSEMVPPAFLPNFNATYPLGFEGNQVCPIRDGDQFLTALGFTTSDWFKWIDLLIVAGFTILFLAIQYVCMRFLHFRQFRSDKNVGGKKEKVKEHRVEVIKKEVEQPSLGCYIQWKNLVYEVDAKKDGKKKRLRLLNEINGYVKPGMLLALMGPSGAGKSTLLDVLAARKTGGHTYGEILINGQPRTKYFTRIAAYVEQFDVLPPTQTVREALQFSAKTRLPESMSDQAKMEFVESILETLNLVKIANQQIGQGDTGLSLSQRKRVNIGIELASDPQLLFLDEPTSGLDSSAALKVMELIKKIASSGRSVICTIHQPSTSIFKKFDHLLLLKRGGETVFFGPTGELSSTVLGYFDERGFPCDPFKNPADFILDVIDENARVKNDQGEMVPFDAVQTFKDSNFNRDLVEKVTIGIMPIGTPVRVFHNKYSSSIWTQFRELFKRCWYGQTRRMSNIRTRIMRSLALGIVLGTMFLRLDYEQVDITSRISLLFFSLMFGGMAGLSVIPIIAVERGVFYREQSSGMYRVWIYLLAFIITDIPFIFASSLTYDLAMYFLSNLNLGVNGWPFFYHVIITFVVYLNFSLLTTCLAVVLPTDELAFTFTGVLLSISSLFAGFIIPPDSIPRGWKWLYYIDSISYPLKSYIITELKDLDFHCTNNEGAVPVPIPSKNETLFFCPTTHGSQTIQRLKLEEDYQYINLAIMAGFTGFFIIIGYLSLRFIRHQNK